MDIIEFLRPHLRGERFEGHAIPLEFLKDLAVLDEMIVEVAKWQYMKSHPERKRSPRGFTSGIEITLTGIEDGSAIPVISLAIATHLLFAPDNQMYFEQARDNIVCAIEAAGQNQSFKEYLPESTIGYFDRMGRSLRDGEAIEFTTPKTKKPVSFTKETRRTLLSSSALTELTEDIEVRGAIPEADQNRMSFHVQFGDGTLIEAPISPQNLDTVIAAFAGYKKSGTRVLLQGVGKFDRLGKIKGFESVEHISILEPLDIPARLDEIGHLKDGWLEGHGTAFDRGHLNRLARVFEQNYADDMPLPHLYPTENGGIQAEWSLGSHEITLEIDLDEQRGIWHELDLELGKATDRNISLQSLDDWKWISEQIREASGGVA